MGRSGTLDGGTTGGETTGNKISYWWEDWARKDRLPTWLAAGSAAGQGTWSAARPATGPELRPPNGCTQSCVQNRSLTLIVPPPTTESRNRASFGRTHARKGVVFAHCIALRGLYCAGCRAGTDLSHGVLTPETHDWRTCTEVVLCFEEY